MVTGGAGFIGSHIVDRLIDTGAEVVVVDNLSTGKRENVNLRAQFYEVDITRPELFDVFAAERPAFVIHQAAQINVPKSLADPVFDAEVNILGTLRVLEGCRRFQVQKIVYASSAAAYGTPASLPVDERHPVAPISYYGISKHSPEHYFPVYRELYGLRYTILRYANVYGIRQDPQGEGGVVSIFTDRLLRGVPPTIYGDGEQTRDFIYVADVAEANLLAIEKGDGETLNISGHRQTTINELLALMNRLAGTNLAPVYADERPGDIRHSVLDNARAVEVLGWRPRYTLEDGLRETLAYYRQEYGR
ncbi:MAG: SDR family oxidoreductase [Firmicutes bacterium]|nr:SDR family oxidoreductase [Bacillota bacterium]